MGIRFQRLLYKTTGIMQKTLRMQVCEDVGQTILKSSKALNKETVSEVLSQALKGRHSKRIKFTDSIDEAKSFANAVKADGAKQVDEALQIGHAVTISDPKNNINLIFLPNVERFGLTEATGLVCHEIEHALHRTNSPQSLPLCIIKLFVGKKGIQKMIDKEGTLGQQNYNKIYEFIKKHFMLGFSEKNCRRLINEEIIIKNSFFKNLEMLRGLKKAMRDEASAYEIQRRIAEVPENKTLYKKISTSFDSFADALQKEQKLLFKNRVRKFFGLKPKETLPKQPISMPKKLPREIVMKTLKENGNWNEEFLKEYGVWEKFGKYF